MRNSRNSLLPPDFNVTIHPLIDWSPGDESGNGHASEAAVANHGEAQPAPRRRVPPFPEAIRRLYSPAEPAYQKAYAFRSVPHWDPFQEAIILPPSVKGYDVDLVFTPPINHQVAAPAPDPIYESDAKTWIPGALDHQSIQPLPLDEEWQCDPTQVVDPYTYVFKIHRGDGTGQTRITVVMKDVIKPGDL